MMKRRGPKQRAEEFAPIFWGVVGLALIVAAVIEVLGLLGVV